MIGSMRELREVAAGVLVATSRRYATTSTVLVSRDRAVLVDPAWDPDELAGLADAVQARGLTIGAGISTHAHHDHLLWHPRFGEVPRWASRRTVQLAAEHRDELLAALGPDWPAELAEVFGRLSTAEPDPIGESDDPIVLVVHDGHVPGHSALWLPARAVLLAGDMLSDLELPLPHDPDDLGAYLAGLEVLAPYVSRAKVLVPGHGSPTDAPASRLDADRRYLDALIAGVDPADQRCGNPGMATVHERNLRLAADYRAG
jgi:glyoxylase-like metal-dependent hydrolase (beta-lactamase superfamily II)